ncbi:MAG: GNAT family N-acetyltransferase [Pseudomonadota bacterium]
MDITLRACQPGDEQALAAIGAATFLESYAGVVDGAAIVRHCAERQTARVYADALADPDQALWICEMAPGAAPVGYLHLAAPDLPIESGPHDLEIKRIYVLSKFHGEGLGRRLLDAADRHAAEYGASRLLLGVYKKNAPALRFYDRAGFSIVGERAFDVGGQVYDDWVLEKIL